MQSSFVKKLKAAVSGQPVADPADMWLQDEDMARPIMTNKPSITQLQNVVMPEGYSDQLKFITDLGRGVDIVDLLTPTNYRRRQEHWFHGFPETPVFEYDIDAQQAFISKIEDSGKFMWRKYDVKDAIRQLFIDLAENRARDLEATSELISALVVGEPHWANQIMNEKYGPLDDEIIIEAATIADVLVEQHERGPAPAKDAYFSAAEQDALFKMSFDAQAIKFWLEWSIGEYGWEIPVEITPRSAYITVHCDPASGISVTIPEKKVVNGVRLLALNRHEIECHARDFMNSMALIRPFGVKHGLGHVDGSSVLAEGHAVLEETKFFKEFFGQDSYPAPWYVLAMDMVKNSHYGFNGTADSIREWLEATGVADPLRRTADAWKYTYRIFRGNGQTGPNDEAERFIFTKDRAYLEGFLVAEGLEKAGLSHWLSLGGFSREELVDIAKVVSFTPEDLPYPDKNTTRSMSALFLADAI